MGIAITKDHHEIAEAVKGLLSRRQARSAARALLDAPFERRPDIWPELAEQGWLGLHVPEEFGGSGYGLAELVVVAEEFGRTVVPGPFLPTVISSAIIAAHAGHADQEGSLLPLRWSMALCALQWGLGDGVDDDRRQEGSRYHRSSEFLGDDDQLGKPIAGPAELFGYVQSQPALFGQLRPDVRTSFEGGVEQCPRCRASLPSAKQSLDGLGYFVVILGDRDTHLVTAPESRGWGSVHVRSSVFTVGEFAEACQDVE